MDGKLIGAAIGVNPVPPSIRLSKLNSPLDGVDIPTDPPASILAINGYCAADFTSKLSGRVGRLPLASLDGLVPAKLTPTRGMKPLLVGVGVSRLSVCVFSRIVNPCYGRTVYSRLEPMTVILSRSS